MLRISSIVSVIATSIFAASMTTHGALPLSRMEVRKTGSPPLADGRGAWERELAQSWAGASSEVINVPGSDVKRTRTARS